MKRSEELEREAVLTVAELMAAAARTAPKTLGIDNVVTVAVDDEKMKLRLSKKMRKIFKLENRPTFERDAISIAKSPVIIIIGVKANPAGLNCGFCGYRTCNELKRTKGVCAHNSIDLGIAASSAASIAGQFYVDNRLMYSVGRASLDLKLFTKDVKQALGIPLSISGKNPFFDRK